MGGEGGTGQCHVEERGGEGRRHVGGTRQRVGGCGRGLKATDGWARCYSVR
jgi:hypothetical protein